MAARVVEAAFPGRILVQDVSEVSEEMVKEWSLTFSQASVVLLGAGPPCQAWGKWAKRRPKRSIKGPQVMPFCPCPSD